MKIGNLLPGKAVTVRLGIVAKLEVVDKSYALLLSPTFTPRYVNRALMQDEDASLPEGASAPALLASRLPYSWEVEVDIAASGPIERLVCVSHKVEIQYGEGRRTARLAMKGPESPDSDFSLLYRYQGISEPAVYLQESQALPKEVAAMVSFFPDFCEASPGSGH